MTKMQVMRRIIAGLALAFFAGALLVMLLLFSRGVQARPPGKWETRVISVAKHRLLVGGRSLKNPLPITSESIAEGRQTFSHYCFACHGLDGQNTGVPFADTMSPPVPSLSSREVQRYTDGQLHWVIENGLWPSGMPAAHGILTDEEIWSIVTYVRNLPSAGSLGEPAAYSGEDCGAPADQQPAPQTMKQPRRSAP